METVVKYAAGDVMNLEYLAVVDIFFPGENETKKDARKEGNYVS